MKGGKLSSELNVPRYLFQWEGLMAFVPDDMTRASARHYESENWDKYINCFLPEPQVRNVMWHTKWDKHQKVEAFSFLPPAARGSISGWLERTHSAALVVQCTSLDEIEGTLPFLRDVAAIVHADGDRQLAYGSRSYYIPDPQKMERLI